MQELMDALKKQKEEIQEEGIQQDSADSPTGERAELPAADRPLLEEEIRVVNKQLTEAQNEAQSAKDRYLRLLAEFENFKKRIAREQTEGIQYANERLIRELLPVLDHLEMTLEHVQPNGEETLQEEKTESEIVSENSEKSAKSQSRKDPIREGVELILKQFLAVLEKFGVEEVCGVGAPFNPHQQETIGMLETNNFSPGSVALVHRKGFLLNGRLLRAALVTVAKEPLGLP